MAIRANDLGKDLKIFEAEDGSVETVEEGELYNFLHVNQDSSLSEGEAGEDGKYTRVKQFFDYLGLHVFLPWLRAITKVLNALKSTVEKEYLKSDRVQQNYDPKSAEPMSGKAVAEAVDKVVELTDADTIWEAIRLTGLYLEEEGSRFWKLSLATKILNTVAHGGIFNGEGGADANTEGWSAKVRVLVRNLSTNELYFINAVEANRAAAEEWKPNPILKPSEITDKVVDALFPMVEAREDITEQANWYALPSDDAKVAVEYEETPSHIYLCAADYSTEPMMYFREGATSPYLLPDDFSDQETAAKLWKAGSYLEAGPISKATLITAKEQTDRRAISPSRLQELIEAATETKTIYTQVARVGDSFALTEEMKENGLVIRRNSPANDYVSGGFTIYDPNGNIDSEPTVSAPAEAGGVVPFDVSSYEVGSQFMFYGGSDGHYGGNLEVQMPFTMKTLSLEKLAALLAEEVSEE